MPIIALLSSDWLSVSAASKTPTNQGTKQTFRRTPELNCIGLLAVCVRMIILLLSLASVTPFYPSSSSLTHSLFSSTTKLPLFATSFQLLRDTAASFVQLPSLSTFILRRDFRSPFFSFLFSFWASKLHDCDAKKPPEPRDSLSFAQLTTTNDDDRSQADLSTLVAAGLCDDGNDFEYSVSIPFRPGQREQVV